MRSFILSVWLLLAVLGALARPVLAAEPAGGAASLSRSEEDEPEGDQEGDGEDTDDEDDEDDEESGELVSSSAETVRVRRRSLWGSTTANVGIVSDYVSRGVSQTDRSPAVQGGFDWRHPFGFYVGAWASNVRPFEDEPATIELNLSAGYELSLARSLTASLGATRISYFRGGPGDGWEFPLRVTWGPWTAETIYSSGGGAFGGSSWYVNGGWSDELFLGISLSANIGYTFYSEIAKEQNEVENYGNFRLALSRELFDVDVELFTTFVTKRQFDGADDPRFGIAVTKAL